MCVLVCARVLVLSGHSIDRTNWPAGCPFVDWRDAVVRVGVRRNAPGNTRRSKPILLRGSVVPVEMRQALTQMAGFMV